MKILYIFFNDFKILFSNRKKIFYMISINLFIVFFAFLYFFTFYYSNYLKNEDFVHRYKPYQVFINQNNIPTSETINTVINKISTYKQLPQIKKLTLHSIETNSEGVENNIIGLFMQERNFENYFVIEKGKFFSLSNLKEDKEIAFISENPFESKYNNIIVDDTIIINSKRYTVIGKGLGDTDDDDIYISYKSFLNNSYDCSKLNINFERRLKEHELEYIRKQFNSSIGFSNVVEPPINNNNLQKLTIQIFVVASVIILAIIAIINIFRYLTIINLDKFVIYILCGMSHIKRFFYLLIDIISLIFILYTISIICFENCAKYLDISTLNFSQYLCIFLVIILSVTVIVGLNFKKIINNIITERL